MKIAVLVSRFPYPLERGDKLRAYHQIKYLSQYHDIYLFAIHDQKIDDALINELAPYCKAIIVEQSSFLDKIIGVGRALLKGWPLQTGIAYKKNLHQKVQRRIKEYNIDLVYCQLIRMAPYCEQLTMPMVLDFMDAFGEGMQKRARLVSFPERAIYEFESKRVIRYEQYCSTLFPTSTIISEQDKIALHTADNSKINVVSNGIDVVQFGPNEAITKKYDVGFVGNLGYLPNIEAAEYLVNVVAKAYEKKYQKPLNIQISGARPDNRVLNLRSATVHIQGWTDDIAVAYQSVNVLCAPIFSGTGQQNKILEAMACGTPVLCNSILNNSIGAQSGQAIVTVDSLDEMVTALHLLVTDASYRKNISNAARQFVVEKYTWDKVTQNLNQCIENAVSNWEK